MAQLAGVHPRTMTNLDDGTFSLADLENKVRQDNGGQVPVGKVTMNVPGAG